MKKSLLITGFLFFTLAVLFPTPAFIDYYNKGQNWDSGTVGNGTLLITEKVDVTQDLVLPNNVTIKLTDQGMLQTNGYLFSITGDPAAPSELDPRTIYVRRVLLIITQLLLDD